MPRLTKHILPDQNIPRKLVAALAAHHVETAFRRGWSSLVNGDLIDAAEAAGFEVMITADRNIEHQQNLKGRRLAIIILDTNRWPRIKPRMASILFAIEAAKGGDLHKVDCY